MKDHKKCLCPKCIKKIAEKELALGPEFRGWDDYGK